MITIKGIVKAIIFEAKDSTYKVLIVSTEDGKKTVTGYFAQIDKEISYTFEGEIVKHARYGEQFKCLNFTRDSFQNSEGLIYYLSSSRFEGIGEKTATKIVETLGLNAIELIIENPDVLNSVKGLGKEKAKKLALEIKENEEVNNVFIRLYSYGLSVKESNILYLKYDKNAISKIEDNPYILCTDIENFGFKKCDVIARNIGIDAHDSRRINEATMYTILEYTYQGGNTFILEDELIKRCIDLLSLNDDSFDELEIKNSIVYLEQVSRVKIIKTRIYPYSLYNAEIETSRILRQMLNFKYKVFSNERINKYISESEKDLLFALTDEQTRAINTSLRNKISIITGGPGTGKTTILNVLISVYAKLMNKSKIDLYNENDILLLAPTGRASRRMYEQTSVPSFTIHKALEYGEDHEFKRNFLNKLNAKLIIVDESSMIDIELFYHLLDAIRLDSRIIFVGDVNQIPSVGPGNVLNDLINSNMFPVSRLNIIMRQISNSNIIKLSNSVINQEIDFSLFNERKEVYFYHLENFEIIPFILKILHKYKTNNLDFYYDIQILCPMYASDCGIDNINSAIQSEFNDSTELVKYGSHIFKVGDKVLQTQNNPDLDLNNGDIGIIKSINRNDSEVILYIMFDNEMVRYPYSNLDELTLGYAISIHKSQGSEYKNVIIPITYQFWPMLRKKLIYTAITRSKEKVILLGNPHVLSEAIKVNEDIRLTSLTRFLLDDTNNDDILDVDLLDDDIKKTENEYKRIEDPKSAFDCIFEELNGITPFTCMEEIKNGN